MDTVKVLVFPSGSEIGLELNRALKDVRYIDLIGVSSVPDHGRVVYAQHIDDAPYLTDGRFEDWLIKTVNERGVDVLVPALDDVIVKFSALKDRLNCAVLCPDEDTARICRDKRLTYELFEGCWFNPVHYRSVEEISAYPVALKPARGQGSQGFARIDDAEHLRRELDDRADDQVICEFLPGQEFTIDCFTDRHGKLQFVAPRTRGRVRTGISVNSRTVELSSEVAEIAATLNERLNLRGAWFFQVRENADGAPRLLEVAPRIAGAMCLERGRGVNLPLLAICDALDLDVDVHPNNYACEVDRAFENVFVLDMDYRSVYLDFDDTLVTNGKVSLACIAFLYQCKNRGIPVYLLTRHDRDVFESLRSAAISEELFAEIIQLDRASLKSDYIDVACQPIFIDDSYAERADVASKLGISTFGPESIEALLGKD